MITAGPKSKHCAQGVPSTTLKVSRHSVWGCPNTPSHRGGQTQPKHTLNTRAPTQPNTAFGRHYECNASRVTSRSGCAEVCQTGSRPEVLATSVREGWGVSQQGPHRSRSEPQGTPFLCMSQLAWEEREHSHSQQPLSVLSANGLQQTGSLSPRAADVSALQAHCITSIVSTASAWK